MSRDSGSSDPSQRTVAELLAEYGGGSERSAHRRRRRAEDPSETAPQAIIERVMSDSGQMRAVSPDAEPPRSTSHSRSRSDPKPPGAPGQATPAGQTPAGQAPAGQAPAGRAPAPQAPTPQPPAPPAPAAQPPKPAPAAPQAQPPPAPPAGPPSKPPPAAAPAPSAPPEKPVNTGESAGTASGFWASRFGAAPKPPGTPAPDAGAGSEDDEATVQQPLPRRPQPYPSPAPVAPPQPIMPEERTELLPKVDAEARNSTGDGTAMLAYPPGADQSEKAGSDAGDDPFDYGDCDEYGEYEQDDGYDPELPAGMGADDYRDDEDDEDEGPQLSSGKDWAVLIAQVGAGLVAGGAVWFAFRWLWIAIPLAALVAALVITGCLVFIAFKFLRTADLQTIMLTVLVGLICTVSPAALLLVGH